MNSKELLEIITSLRKFSDMIRLVKVEERPANYYYILKDLDTLRGENHDKYIKALAHELGDVVQSYLEERFEE